jgi:3-oxoacyl-[acyl-carrier protein] reductase
LRLVVVSGGGTGIGRATAQVFAAGGDHVVILGRRGDVLERAAAELNAVAIQADLTDPTQVEEAVASLPDVVDVLVNNAGGVPEIDVEDGALGGLARFWDAVWRSNVVSAVLLTEALLPRLRRPGGADRQPELDRGAARERRLRRREGGDRRVDVQPREAARSGGHQRERRRARLRRGHGVRRRDRAERRQRLVEETLLGRPATPADVAATIHFLASDGAGHITGQVLQVNGGALLGRWPLPFFTLATR